MSGTETETHAKRQRIIRKGRLSGAQRNRLRRLLNMMYNTRELAREIGVSSRLIREVYVPFGCPHTRNRQNHIMINGESFRKWYQNVYKKRALAKDEAFCVTCGTVLKISNPSSKKADGLSYLVTRCPDCGRRVAKITDMERTSE